MDALIQGALEAGNEVARFDAAFQNVHECLACQTCQSNGGKCVHHDDMEELYPRLLEADAVVFASPVYYNDICGQLKTVIDRFFAQETALRNPKRAAVLLAFGDSTMEAVQGILFNLRAMFGFFGWKLEDADIVAGSGCNCAADIQKTDYPQKAYELGKRIGIDDYSHRS